MTQSLTVTYSDSQWLKVTHRDLFWLSDFLITFMGRWPLLIQHVGIGAISQGGGGGGIPADIYIVKFSHLYYPFFSSSLRHPQLCWIPWQLFSQTAVDNKRAWMFGIYSLWLESTQVSLHRESTDSLISLMASHLQSRPRGYNILSYVEIISGNSE